MRQVFNRNPDLVEENEREDYIVRKGEGGRGRKIV